jgi:hypothetical protein
MYIDEFTYISIQTNIYMDMYTYIYIYTDIYTYVYIYICKLYMHIKI